MINQKKEQKTSNRDSGELLTGTPAQAGIPASAVLAFLKRLEQYQVPLHSVLLYRRGILAFEGYFAPYDADTLHRMFSVCKTMNALAIGLLCEEGRLSLDDPITGYFPDMVPEDPHPFLTSMTIRDMLMMRTCHAQTTYKKNPHEEWIRSFFTTPPTHKPGTVFHYDTSAAHVLCALVERLSGKPMLSYLKERVLNEIGWSKDSYVLKNEFGDSHGGSGLMATPRDLLLIAKLMMQEGRWNGKQLLPADFLKQMTSPLTSNAVTGSVHSETQGYGYQVWCNAQGGFVLYGMGGQLAVCLPKEELILVTTADTQGMGGGNDLIYNSFYETILPALDTMQASCRAQASEAQKKEQADTLLLQKISAGLRMTPPKKWVKTTFETTPDSFLAEDTLADVINHTEYRLAENPQGFSSLSLNLTEDKGILSYRLKGTDCRLVFGLEECITGKFPLYDMKCASGGVWLAPDTFYIRSNLTDTSVGAVHMELVFSKEDVTVFMRKTEETLFTEYTGHLYGTK